MVALAGYALVSGFLPISGREQRQVVAGRIGEDGKPANTGNFGLGQNSFATMGFDIGK